MELKVTTGDSGSVYVWDNQNKTGKVLPKDGEPSPERWKIQWGVPASVKIEYIEGRWPAQQTSLAWNYVINDDDYVKYGTETYTPVVLEVDIDIAGVKDDHYVWPGVTEETTPGASVALGGFVEIERLKILPEDENKVPVNPSQFAVLKANSGSSKIRIWSDEQKTQEYALPYPFFSRSSIPSSLWIEGYNASESAGDVTLSLWWNDYEDEIKITVVKVDKIVLEGTSTEGPVDVWAGSSVDMEAVPHIEDALFPDSEPQWSIYDQPSGADASLTPDEDPTTATLSNINVVGNYTAKAECGDSDMMLLRAFDPSIDIDVKDKPPTGATYASGINPSSIILKLNGVEVTPTITPITDGYHIHYTPSLAVLNPPGQNTVSLIVRDYANAGREEGQEAWECGNPLSDSPYTWSH